MASSSDTKDNNADLIDLGNQAPPQSGIQDLSLSNTEKRLPEQSQLSSKDDFPPSYQAVAGDKQPPFKAIDYVKDGRAHVLLAASGSVAVETLPVIVDRLVDETGVAIRIVLDKLAARHLLVQDLLKLPRVEAVYTDDDWKEDASSLHFELRTWLDFMLVAPCDPSTLAKLTNGIGDDLLTSILRVFDADGKLNPPGRRGRFKYLAIAPAMDSVTWAQPITKEHLATLHNRWSYVRSFTKDRIPWAVTIKPLNLDAEDFNCFEDNCNLNMARIMMEIRWQVDKFRKGHAWYAPGG